MTSLISPVLLQPPPERKKFASPFHTALQVSWMLTLMPMLLSSHGIASHFFTTNRTWLR